MYFIQTPYVSQQQGQVLCLFTLLAAEVNKQAGLQHSLHSVQTTIKRAVLSGVDFITKGITTFSENRYMQSIMCLDYLLFFF